MGIREESKEKMGHVVDHFKEDLKSIRTGRANPALVDNIPVEVYGTNMRIKEMASVNAPEARTLIIVPFDPKNASIIGKAIEIANIGIRPIVDANQVRINIPPMDQNLRKEMVKMLHKKREDSKVAIRNIRRDLNEKIRKAHKAGDLAEDQVKKGEKEIQEETDNFCKKIDDVSNDKEKEIMTV